MSNLTTRSPPSPEAPHLQRERRLEHLERVALVTGNYINVIDGAVKALHRVVDSLTERGVEVAVVAPGGPQKLPRHDVMFEVPSLPFPVQGYRFPLGLGRRAKARLEAFDPQIVHVASPDPANLMAMRFAKKRDLPIVSSFHTNFPSYLKYWGRLWGLLTPAAWKLLQWFYAPCDEVFVPTPSIGEVLEQKGVLDKWGILARGVDPGRFGPGFRSSNWRWRHGIGVEEHVVLFCTRLVWEKGLRTLVATLEHLRRLDDSHRVLIVGDGDQRHWLEKQLPDAIFTGYLVGDELARAHASSDLFLHPATTETFGNVTLEAMASGLPVVGARAPGTRSLVVDGKTGLLAEPDDPNELAEACNRLLKDDMLRRRLGRAAFERSKQYRWATVLDEFALELDELVAKAHPERQRA